VKYLWVRLTLAFSSVTLISIVLLSMAAFLTFRLNGALSSLEAIRDQEGKFALLTMQQERELHRQQGYGLLILASVGGTVGLAAGIWMSRTLAAPLNELAQAAKTIGAGDLSRRVNIKGTQEMVDVAVAFNQMASELETATQLRRNLMADVAHELRTPLTVLQGNLRAILDDVYAMDKTEIARLYEQTRHLTQLVEDLRIVALAESGQLPLNLEEVDAMPLLQDIHANFGPIADEEGIGLVAELPDERLLTRIDTARIKQVLYNLLSNAIRHTPAGGSISLLARSAENEIGITVSDTGDGITVEHLDRIFDRFYRTDPARTRDAGGTGLGLAIVKAIVEAHDGHVGVSSAGPGKGTDFTIWLPLCQLGLPPNPGG
jgi:two-component system OmpR family sensor kinase/two-component system sensor histidine kinase BaeS